MNCEEINNSKGKCQKCKEDYYLNVGDKKCIKTENCYESIFGNCLQCKAGYYYNKKEDKCVEAKGNFIFCKQALDEDKCDICDEHYFLDEEGKCGKSNFCAKFAQNGTYEKCMQDYYPSSFDNSSKRQSYS